MSSVQHLSIRLLAHVALVILEFAADRANALGQALHNLAWTVGHYDPAWMAELERIRALPGPVFDVEYDDEPDWFRFSSRRVAA
jgi:hypothetical protein